MEIVIGFFVVVVLVFVIRSIADRLSKKNEKPTANLMTPAVPTKVFQSTAPVVAEPPKETALSEAERRYAQMKDALRPLPHEGVEGTRALTQRLSVGDALLSKDDILNAAVDVGFTMGSVIGAMDASGFSLSEIFTFVDDHFTFDIPKLVKLLFALHHESSSIDWTTFVVSTVCEKYNADDLDYEDIRAFADGGLSVGCTRDEIAKILYTEFSFQAVLIALAPEEGVTPEIIAQVARGADVDLTDSELYDSLRQDYSLALVAGALQVLGKTCDTVLDCEAAYLNSEYENVSAALEDMKDSGFSVTEVLVWLIGSGYSTLGAEDVIADAFEDTDEEGLSEDTLVQLSLTLEDEVDIGEIERQLIENGVDFEDRVEFLYKLFVTQRDARVAKEARPVTEEGATP